MSRLEDSHDSVNDLSIASDSLDEEASSDTLTSFKPRFRFQACELPQSGINIGKTVPKIILSPKRPKFLMATSPQAPRTIPGLIDYQLPEKEAQLLEPTVEFQFTASH